MSAAYVYYGQQTLSRGVTALWQLTKHVSGGTHYSDEPGLKKAKTVLFASRKHIF